MARETVVAQQWIFSGVTHDGQRGTVKVIRKLREGLQMDYETNTLSVVTYYDATWRGDAGGVERFCLTPHGLDMLRNPPTNDEQKGGGDGA